MHLLPGSHRGTELEGLGTPDQIALFIEQQKALIVQAEREEVQQRVRLLKFDLFRQGVFLALAVAVGVGLVVGLVFNPELIKVAGIAASALAAIAAALYGYRQRREKDP